MREKNIIEHVQARGGPFSGGGGGAGAPEFACVRGAGGKKQQRVKRA